MRGGRGLVIGLLGGSFNPAHGGHRHLSLEALRRLGLDQVWWLVSPQNPLKSANGMAPLARRLDQARQVARHPRIRVTALEVRLGTVFTAETLTAMSRSFRQVRFVWLMGADNLQQIHRWAAWTRIFRTMPVAVFARPSYCLGALAGRAAHRFARARLPEAQARTLADGAAPRWVFLHIPLNPVSATGIRAADLSR